jgi:hypothetical protein
MDMGYVVIIQYDRTAVCRLQACNCINQFRLPVSIYTGNTNYFTGMHIK